MEKLDPKINPEINKFLRAIYGESQGWVPVVTRSEEGNLDSERWRYIPDEWRGLGINCSVRADEDVYVSVAVFTDKRRTNEDRGAVARAVYADADTCDPKNFRLPPSIVVTTSPGRYHCWWVLDEEVPASEASEAAHRISEAHKKQGCDRGWIVSKILRVPGTTNTKDGQEFTVTAEYSDNVYTLDTINEAYHDVDLNPEIDLNQKMPTKIGSKDLIELEKVISRENLTSLYLEAPQEGQSWSERLFKLELELFRAGLDAKDVFTLARNSACNKYNPENAGQLTKTGVPIPKRKNPDKVLWAEILKAQAEYEATKDIEVEQQYEPRFVLDQKFLTVDEVRYLEQNPTFIDEYTAWVATRTDSAPTYQKTFAWMILSTLFGERGYLKAKHGVMNLNLWVQVLGDTCQPLDSKILTPLGWTTLGEVREGDFVIGRHGEPVRVKAVKKTKMDDVYKVKFHNGAEVESTLDHLWTIRGSGGKERTVTLSEIIRLKSRGDSVSLPYLSAPVEYSRNETLMVDPYLLGIWLSEGCRDPQGYRAEFSSDGEINSLVEERLPPELKLTTNKSANRMSYAIIRKDSSGTGQQGENIVRDGLRTLGLIDKYQKDRWIPEEYLYSSSEDRLALLQGVMDGDGSVGKNGATRFECISEQLTLDVAELAKSLGMVVGKVSEQRPTTAGNKVYRVNFRPVRDDINPFRLPRKAGRVTLPKSIHTGIKSVEFSRHTEVKCISVDSDDEMYVTDDFILTHNTSTRKSTALNLYLRVIRKYEELMDDSYLAGSNVTQEGLTKFLKDRDGKVSVLHTDEVNGFFKEVFEKSYQTGLLEFFTELYDGELQVVLRAGKDAGNEKSASTIFNFIGVGIRETTGRILLQEHFSTGFLARMLWCVADPKPRVAGSDAWEEADDEDTKFEDRGLNQVVDNLVDRTRMWHSEDKAVRIKGTAEADARYNQWIEDGFAALDEIGYKDLLTAPYKRLIFSVRKAAALLAMYEQSHVIEIRHMVAALSQSELWFNDMVRMALEVSSTGFERKLDEVESFIRSTTSGVNGVLESTIRKKHSKFKPQEQDEILRALNEQGRIRKVKGTHNRWEVLE